MRDLILDSLKKHLNHHGPESMRWFRVKEMIIPFWDNNPGLKKSKRDIKQFSIHDFDYTQLSDEDLLKVYNIILYQYTKMY